jgi:hypothetical protein
MVLLLKPAFMSNGIQNDQFFISHRHYEEDSLPNIEESEEAYDDNASNSSVVHIRQYSAAKKKPSSVLLATV